MGFMNWKWKRNARWQRAINSVFIDSINEVNYNYNALNRSQAPTTFYFNPYIEYIEWGFCLLESMWIQADVKGRHNN